MRENQGPTGQQGRPRARVLLRGPLPRALAAVLMALGVLAAYAVPAALPGGASRAHAAARQFGPAIEPHATYEAQQTCDPAAKPGTRALAEHLVRTYPGTGNLGITRACHLGGRSEHKEGRAFDWKVDWSDPRQRAQAEAFLDRLLATDEFGNQHALARRMGVMYVIWDRAVWAAYSPGWRPYSGASAHRDHVHISLTWAGAMGRTSFWSGQVAAPTPTPPSRPGAAPAPGSGSPGAPPVLDQKRVPDAVVSVPGTGKAVRTPFSLAAGRTYRLVAVGTYRYGTGTQVADAACRWQPYEDGGWQRHESRQQLDVRLKLTVDGAAGWRPRSGTPAGCDGSHVYVWDHTPWRTGPLSLQVMADGAVPGSGALQVHVLSTKAAPSSVRATPTPASAPAPKREVLPAPDAEPLQSETVLVPARSPAGVLTSAALVAGEEYLLEIDGTYDDGEGLADAECSRRSFSSTWKRRTSVDPHRPDADHLDLYLNGLDLDAAPGLDTGERCDGAGHRYSTAYLPSTTGRGRLALWDPRPGDNSGRLRVRISRVPAAARSGLTTTRLEAR